MLKAASRAPFLPAVAVGALVIFCCIQLGLGGLAIFLLPTVGSHKISARLVMQYVSPTTHVVSALSSSSCECKRRGVDHVDDRICCDGKNALAVHLNTKNFAALLAFLR